MALKLKTAAASDPVTSAEFKTFERITGSLQDAVISSLISTATEEVQNICNVQLIDATYELYLNELCDEIKIPIGPLDSIVSIKYQDEDDVQQALSSSLYKLDDVSPIPRVLKKKDAIYPSTLNERNVVIVEFIAGYGALGSDVPEQFKTLIKMIAGSLYETREADQDKNYMEVPAIQRLYNLCIRNYRF